MKLRLLALSLVALLAACAQGSDTGEATAPASCRAACACTGCSDSELKSCVDDTDDMTRDAQEADCNAQLDSYLSCMANDAECVDGDLDVSFCGAEDQELRSCISPPPVKSPSQTSGAGGGSGSCASTYNGICDEPEGTGLCAEGTDSYDCGVTSTSSTGTGGSGSCASCSEYMTDTSSTLPLCPASEPIAQALVDCVCTGSCGTSDCYNTCAGSSGDVDCNSCMQTYCSSQMNTCLND